MRHIPGAAPDPALSALKFKSYLAAMVVVIMSGGAVAAAGQRP